MIRLILPAAAAAAVLLVAVPAGGQEVQTPPAASLDPGQVLAYQGDAVLTHEAIDAAFSRIPEQHRLAFIRDGAKVDQMVTSLLHARIVAADARAAGYADDPLIRERLQQAVDKELAEAWIEEVVRRAPQADYEALAREDYLANPAAYAPEPSIDVSHILIGTEQRGTATAESLANQLRSELDQDPARFDELVRQYSDDPAKATNGGKYPRMKRGQMVKPFENAAFALEKPGQIGGPVKTQYGYHLIRLDARNEPVVPSYDKVKDEAVERARSKYLNAYRAGYLQKLMKDPVVFPDGSVEVMARRHFGEDLEKAPIFDVDARD